MEASHLFLLGSVFGQELRETSQNGELLCGAVLAVIGDDQPFSDAAIGAAAVERAIELSLHTLKILARWDRPA
jgi:hypothetical protein